MPRKRKEPPPILYPQQTLDDTKTTLLVDHTAPNKQRGQGHGNAKQINHPVSIVPILDYESIFTSTKKSSSCISATSEIQNKDKEYTALKKQAIRNLESDPTLLHIFHERKVGVLKKLKPSDVLGNSFNSTNPSNSKLVSKWVPVKRHRFYHSGFYEPVIEGGSEDPLSSSTCTVKPPIDKDTVSHSTSIPSSSSSQTAHRPRLKDGAFPVYSACTCMTSITLPSPSSSSLMEYVAVGDSAGYVTLYTMSPLVSAMNRLETSASKREFLQDDEFFKEQQDRKKRGNPKRIGVTAILVRNLDDKASISSQCINAIEVVCFTSSASHVIVGTKMEMESIDCFTGSIVWTIPLSSIPACFLTGAINPATTLGNSTSKYMTRGSITRLDAHPWMNDGGILASFTFGSGLVVDKDDELPSQPKNNNSATNTTTTAPCLFFRHVPIATEMQESTSVNSRLYSNMIPTTHTKDDSTNASLYIGPCALAIWDRSKKNRILGSFLTWEGTVDPSISDDSINFRHELILFDHENQFIEYRVELPTKLSPKYAINMSINQTENGTYSIITSNKIGIRLYVTEGLQALATYGEGISIHNSIINWQDCFFMEWGKKDGELDSQFDSVKQWRRGFVREREDEVSFRAQSDKRAAHVATDQQNQDSLNNLFIVGIPCAFKEPLDLNNTVHVWDLSAFDYIAGQKLPSFTLKIPGKSASITSLAYCADHRDGENGTLLLISQSGDFFHLCSTTVSDWAGAMYDPGYQVVDDNIIFIEDEDALDTVVATSSGSIGSNDVTLNKTDSRGRIDRNQIFLSELELALKLSVIEQKLDSNDSNINFDILGHEAARTLAFPCHPERYLQGITSSSSLESAIAKSKVTVDWAASAFLDLFPQMNEAFNYIESEKIKSSKKIMTFTESCEAGNVISHSNCPSKKRSKAILNQEAIMESIDLSLRKALLERESFADGSGSLPSIYCLKSSSTTATEGLFCSACSGRMVRHVCGRRNPPVDLSLLEKEPKENKVKRRTEKVKRPKPNTKKSSTTTVKLDSTLPEKDDEEEETQKLQDSMAVQTADIKDFLTL